MIESILTTETVTAEQLNRYHTDGYLIVRGLFSQQEVTGLLDHFMAMHSERRIPNYRFLTPEEAGGDPLNLYPRIMHPHRFDALSKRWLLEPRVADILRELLGEEPVAAQSMLYFKPPHARGQAFHQDNLYLRVKPTSCIATWIALDRSDPDNGGLSVCPGTHTMQIACPEKADLNISFCEELVRPPVGRDPIPAILDPGDVLFFNGSVVHGSTPNTSDTRWRRSLICHYAPASMQEISHFYAPILDMAGNELTYPPAQDGGPCGSEATEAH